MQAYTINKSGSIPEILLYGLIGEWQEVDSNQFVSELKKLEQEYDRINIRISSAGGDVFQGITIFNSIKNSPSEIHTYVDGIAASMASIIALGGHTCHMAKNSMMMIHRVSGSIRGDADKLRQTAALLDELETTLIQIYAERTGKDEATIRNTWLNGNDVWFTAKQAIAENLADEIYDGPITKKPTAKIKGENELWQFYSLQITNQINKDMELNQFINLFSLPENAKQEDVITAIQNQSNLISDLKNQLTALSEEKEKLVKQLENENKSKIENLVNNSIKEKRITENQRSVYLTLAHSNYEATASALSSIQPYVSISSQLQASNNEDEYKTFSEYQKKAPALLADMKKNNYEKYLNLLNKEFNITK